MRTTGIGGTPGIPYEQDTEYWVRFLNEHWQAQLIPSDVIRQIRSASNMFEAQQTAMEFHDRMLRR